VYSKSWFFLISLFIVSSNPLAIASAPGTENQSIQKEIKAELSSKDVMAGTLALVKVTVPKNKLDQVSGSFEGIELPFFELPDLGEGALGAVLAVPYERSPGAGSVVVKVGEESIQVPFQIRDGNYRSEVLKVDGRRVNPTSKKDLVRIKAEQAEVGKIYRRLLRKKYWSGPFVLPIQSKITSPFGTKRVYNGQLKNFHPGLDLKAPMKTPVYSAAAGEVVLAKSLFYSGNTVMVDHGYGIVTLYCHLSKIKVKPGQTIKSHDLVGLSGMTGRVNGPHLHWQAVVHQIKVNPLGLIQEMK
jgi:murein DD-endopeptidase MepM/ murein hydrolase activator NlpD